MSQVSMGDLVKVNSLNVCQRAKDVAQGQAYGMTNEFVIVGRVYTTQYISMPPELTHRLLIVVVEDYAAGRWGESDGGKGTVHLVWEEDVEIKEKWDGKSAITFSISDLDALKLKIDSTLERLDIHDEHAAEGLRSAVSNVLETYEPSQRLKALEEIYDACVGMLSVYENIEERSEVLQGNGDRDHD